MRLSCARGDQEEYFAIGGGFVEVQPDHVTILADSAEHAEEIDHERAARARERAEKLMAEGVPEDPEYYAQIRASLMRAQVRMDVARRAAARTMPTGRVSRRRGPVLAVAFLTPHIAIDLGTVNVLVVDQSRGIVLQEPSVVAVREDGNKTIIVEVGRAAKDMYGRTPEEIEVMRPLRDGVIADYFVTQGMLEYFISKVAGRFHLRKPIVMISVPYGVTSVERRAVREAALAAGAREVHLIPEPLAAAIGAGLPVGTPTGNLVVDLGGGSTEAAVVSMNGIVCAESVRVAGVHLDEAIISYIRKKYNLVSANRRPKRSRSRLARQLSWMNNWKCRYRDATKSPACRAPLPSTPAKSPKRLPSKWWPLSMSCALCWHGHLRSYLRTSSIAAWPSLAAALCCAKSTPCSRRETGVPAYVADNPIACTALGAGKALAELTRPTAQHPRYVTRMSNVTKEKTARIWAVFYCSRQQLSRLAIASAPSLSYGSR